MQIREYELRCPVDSGTIVIADIEFFKPWKPWKSWRSLGNYITLPSGEYIVKWVVKDDWLRGNKNPHYEILKVSSRQAMVIDPCYIVNNSKWMQYLEKYDYHNKIPEGVIAIKTGGDGEFTVKLEVIPGEATIFKPCSRCGDPTVFQRHTPFLPEEGEVCSDCGEWFCQQCIDWRASDFDPICYSCAKRKEINNG